MRTQERVPPIDAVDSTLKGQARGLKVGRLSEPGNRCPCDLAEYQMLWMFPLAQPDNLWIEPLEPSGDTERGQ